MPKDTPALDPSVLEGEAGDVAALNAALAAADPAFVAAALGTLVRGRGTGTVAERAGLPREQVAALTGHEGAVRLATLVRVLRALDLRLEALPRA